MKSPSFTNVLFTSTGNRVRDIARLNSNEETWYKGKVFMPERNDWKHGLWNSSGKAQFENIGDLS